MKKYRCQFCDKHFDKIYQLNNGFFCKKHYDELINSFDQIVREKK